MSSENQKQMEWIIRIITVVLLGIATMYGKSVVEKTDKMYDFVIKHEERIMHQQKAIDELQTYIRQRDKNRDL